MHKDFCRERLSCRRLPPLQPWEGEEAPSHTGVCGAEYAAGYVQGFLLELKGKRLSLRRRG